MYDCDSNVILKTTKLVCFYQKFHGDCIIINMVKLIVALILPHFGVMFDIHRSIIDLNTLIRLEVPRNKTVLCRFSGCNNGKTSCYQ